MSSMNTAVTLFVVLIQAFLIQGKLQGIIQANHNYNYGTPGKVMAVSQFKFELFIHSSFKLYARHCITVTKFICR